MADGTKHDPREQTSRWDSVGLPPSVDSTDPVDGGEWYGDNLWYMGLHK